MSTIVIGVDSTARSEDAVALGRQLAQASSAVVVVASVVSLDTAPDGPSRQNAHLTVRRMSGLLTGIESARIRTGVVAARTPAQGLIDLANAEAATLLVVGSTHTGRLGRVRPGSTGERLLHGAPCAVAVAPRGYRLSRGHRIARVGVAYNGSPESRAALTTAITAARAVGATLRVIAVIPQDLAGAAGLISGPSYAAVRADVEADIRRDVEQLVAGLPADVSPAGVVLEGQPSRMLADETLSLDLLFIGSRGYGPMRAVIAGATSGAVLRQAHCPVIVLPRTAEASLDAIFGDPADAVRTDPAR